MKKLNGRLRIAAVLLLARGAWSGGLAVLFLGAAAFLYWTHSTTSTTDSAFVGNLLTFLIAGALAVIGVVGLAIAVPSLAFGFLIRTGKRWACWVVLIGEGLVGVALAGLAILAFAHVSDRGLALGPAAALVLVSGPVIVLLIVDLRSGAAPARSSSTEVGR